MRFPFMIIMLFPLRPLTSLTLIPSRIPSHNPSRIPLTENLVSPKETETEKGQTVYIIFSFILSVVSVQLFIFSCILYRIHLKKREPEETTPPLESEKLLRPPPFRVPPPPNNPPVLNKKHTLQQALQRKCSIDMKTSYKENKVNPMYEESDV